MKSLDLFISHLSPWVPNCPRAAMRQALIDRMRELCMRSSVWTYRPRDWPATNYGGDDFTFEIPAHTEALRLVEAWVDGDKLAEIAEEDLASESSWWTQTGAPVGFVRTGPDSYRLWPMPSAAVDVQRPKIAIMPALGATEAGDVLYDRYGSQIARGAAAQLMLMPAKPWSNPKLAGVYEQQFQAAVDRASFDQATNFGNRALRTRAYYK